MDPSEKLRLYCSWFCPYAQRAWIALEAKNADYQYIEINPYEDPQEGSGETKIAKSLKRKAEDYPDFVSASPKGLVPALECGNDKVHESMVCVEYIDEALPGRSLLPVTPIGKAKARLIAIHCNEKIIPYYYKMLMGTSAENQDIAKQELLEGLRSLVPMLDPEGPFFLGHELWLADIALAPWWERMLSVSGFYRSFKIPNEGQFQRLHKWYAACQGNEAFYKTIVDQEKLIANYSGYANNSATSDVAKKFRSSD